MPSKPMGRVEKIVRRLLIEAAGEAICTTDIVRRAYPARPRLRIGPGQHQTKFTVDRYRAARRAARRFAVPIGRSPRGRGKPVIWAPKPSLRALITGE
jgi:hypothetical protein